MPDQFDPDFPTRYRKLPVTVEAIRYTPGTSGHSRAMRRMSDEPGVPDAIESGATHG